MAIAVDAVSTGSDGNGTTSVSVNHTIGAGSDRYLLVLVSLFDSSDGGRSVSGINWNTSEAMTRIAFRQNSFNNLRAEIWGLKNPTTGAHSAAVSFTGNVRCTVTVISVTGVDQTTPAGTAAGADGTSSTASCNVSSAANELVFDAVVVQDGTVTISVGADQTQRSNLASSDPRPRGGTSTEPGAATTTMSWTLSGGADWAITGVPLKPAGGGGGSSWGQQTSDQWCRIVQGAH